MIGDPLALLARSAKLKLFVMLRRTIKPEIQRDSLGDHLQWMIGAEKAGHIFLSGPVAPRDGATALDGLTLIRAATLQDAEAIAQGDPFVARGIVAFEMREWTANEGALSLTVTLSDSTVDFL
jgi:uncharacterized protein YciI